MPERKEITKALVRGNATLVAESLWPKDDHLKQHLKECNYSALAGHLHSLAFEQASNVADFFINVCIDSDFPNPIELADFWTNLTRPDLAKIKLERRRRGLRVLTDELLTELKLNRLFVSKTDELLGEIDQNNSEDFRVAINTLQGSLREHADKFGRYDSFDAAVDITRMGIISAFGSSSTLMANVAATCAGWQVLKGTPDRDFVPAMLALEGIYQQGYYPQGFKERFFRTYLSLFDATTIRRDHQD